MLVPINKGLQTLPLFSLLLVLFFCSEHDKHWETNDVQLGNSSHLLAKIEFHLLAQNSSLLPFGEPFDLFQFPHLLKAPDKPLKALHGQFEKLEKQYGSKEKLYDLYLSFFNIPMPKHLFENYKSSTDLDKWAISPTNQNQNHLKCIVICRY